MHSRGTLGDAAHRISRNIFESSRGARVRNLSWLRNARKDSLAVANVASRANLQQLDLCREFEHIAEFRNCGFILGSGTSINELSERNFEIIGGHYSIGINAWALHPFIPNAYAIETHRHGGPPDADTKYLTSLLEQKLASSKNTKFFMLRPNLPSTPAKLISPPQHLLESRLLYGRANLVTAQETNIEKDLHKIFSNYEKSEAPVNILPDNGASVVRMMVLLALMGFKKIVLAGVDLSSSGYFWQSDSRLAGDDDVQRLFGRPTGVPHSTLHTGNRPFSTKILIQSIAKVINDRYSIETSVTSDTSTLSDFLPIFKF